MSPTRSALAVGSIILGLRAIGVVAGSWTEPAAGSNVAASLTALSSPFAPPVNTTTFTVPVWTEALEIATLLAGYVLAVWAAYVLADWAAYVLADWAAHATAFSCVPDRSQAIRTTGRQPRFEQQTNSRFVSATPRSA
ncbi:hypothetical protein [Natronorubrum tibetense]|uniref:hypothetical protein n=1 Tax=Natronorubrum tibetense TaxID=63128 RepID=UPI001F4D1377|nr:hypothetical protein [Natronorubrum tibetense]